MKRTSAAKKVAMPRLWRVGWIKTSRRAIQAATVQRRRVFISRTLKCSHSGIFEDLVAVDDGLAVVAVAVGTMVECDSSLSRLSLLVRWLSRLSTCSEAMIAVDNGEGSTRRAPCVPKICEYFFFFYSCHLSAFFTL